MIDPVAIKHGWDGASPDGPYFHFIFCEGSSPNGKTHVFAWDGKRWVLPCDTLDNPRVATYTKPLCKICGPATAQLNPYPAKRP